MIFLERFRQFFYDNNKVGKQQHIKRQPILDGLLET